MFLVSLGSFYLGFNNLKFLNKENFFKETDIHDEWLKEFGELKENAPFNRSLQLLDNFDNLIYHSKINSNQIKYKPNKTIKLNKTNIKLISKF